MYTNFYIKKDRKVLTPIGKLNIMSMQVEKKINWIKSRKDYIFIKPNIKWNIIKKKLNFNIDWETN